MKKIGNITRIIGLAIRFAPVIITVIKALEMVKKELETLKEEDDSKN